MYIELTCIHQSITLEINVQHFDNDLAREMHGQKLDFHLANCLACVPTRNNLLLVMSVYYFLIVMSVYYLLFVMSVYYLLIVMSVYTCYW